MQGDCNKQVLTLSKQHELVQQFARHCLTIIPVAVDVSTAPQHKQWTHRHSSLTIHMCSSVIMVTPVQILCTGGRSHCLLCTILTGCNYDPQMTVNVIDRDLSIGCINRVPSASQETTANSVHRWCTASTTSHQQHPTLWGTCQQLGSGWYRHQQWKWH